MEKMTKDKMREIILSTPFDELVKNSGIYVIYEDGNLSLGVSRESDNDCGERYIYNIFWGDEYINICGYIRTRHDSNIEPIISDLYAQWSDLES